MYTFKNPNFYTKFAGQVVNQGTLTDALARKMIASYPDRFIKELRFTAKSETEMKDEAAKLTLIMGEELIAECEKNKSIKKDMGEMVFLSPGESLVKAEVELPGTDDLIALGLAQKNSLHKDANLEKNTDSKGAAKADKPKKQPVQDGSNLGGDVNGSKI